MSQQYTKLLINEPPLQVLPSLASAIGLNESIFVQQIHYWIGRSDSIVNGHTWVYKTAEDWQKEFPFWSTKTIRRIVSSCEKKGVIKTGVFNSLKMDRTKWFRIDYKWLAQFEKKEVDKQSKPCGQDGQMEEDKMSTAIPESTSENTTDTICGYSEPSTPKPSSARKSGNKEPFVPPQKSEVEAWAADWASKHSKDARRCQSVALDAFNYYSRMDWVKSNNKAVVDWKRTIAGVWFTDEKISGKKTFGGQQDQQKRTVFTV